MVTKVNTTVLDSTNANVSFATTANNSSFLGGVAAASFSRLGVGQTWQNVTASRALATTYTNNTGRPIVVNVVQYNGGANGVFITLIVDGVTIDRDGGWPGGGNPMYANVTGIVPNGSTYRAEATGGNATGSLNIWAELR